MSEKKDQIPLPAPAEKEAVVARILDNALQDPRPAWRRATLSVLFFGVEDCVFLAAALLMVFFYFTVSFARYAPVNTLAAILFLFSPAMYTLPHILTMWKDAISGTLDWKRTCRISLGTLLALRMLLFGGAAVAVSVPSGVLFWLVSGRRISLLWLLGLSFSSLFLYAALSLFCRKRGRWGALIPPALWVLLGLALDRWEQGGELLLQIPALVFFLLAGLGLACYLKSVCAMLRESGKGMVLYAVR